MKGLTIPALILVTALTSCTTPKSYFTVGIRNKVESKAIPLSQLQFYVDRDVELRRELASGDLKVTSGKVVLENGKYIHIILLKQYTPGVCVQSGNGLVDVAFEMGDGKKLQFGIPDQRNEKAIYQITAQEWIGNTPMNRIGRITYDGNTYFIQNNGIDAKLMIKKSVMRKLEVEKRVMKGVKVQ
jgi:hypothetical protein